MNLNFRFRSAEFRQVLEANIISKKSLKIYKHDDHLCMPVRSILIENVNDVHLILKEIFSLIIELKRNSNTIDIDSTGPRIFQLKSTLLLIQKRILKIPLEIDKLDSRSAINHFEIVFEYLKDYYNKVSEELTFLSKQHSKVVSFLFHRTWILFQHNGQNTHPQP